MCRLYDGNFCVVIFDLWPFSLALGSRLYASVLSRGTELERMCTTKGTYEIGLHDESWESQQWLPPPWTSWCWRSAGFVENHISPVLNGISKNVSSDVRGGWWRWQWRQRWQRQHRWCNKVGTLHISEWRRAGPFLSDLWVSWLLLEDAGHLWWRGALSLQLPLPECSLPRYVSQMTSESHFADPEYVLPQFSLLPKLFRNSKMPYWGISPLPFSCYLLAHLPVSHLWDLNKV